MSCMQIEIFRPSIKKGSQFYSSQVMLYVLDFNSLSWGACLTSSIAQFSKWLSLLFQIGPLVWLWYSLLDVFFLSKYLPFWNSFFTTPSISKENFGSGKNFHYPKFALHSQMLALCDLYYVNFGQFYFFGYFCPKCPLMK